MGAWAVQRAALRDVWDDLLTATLCSLLWAVLVASLVGGPPATLALFYVANRIAHGQAADTRDFLHGLRRYFGLGWRWGLVNGLALFVLVGDVVLVGQLDPSGRGRFIQGMFATGALAWGLVQLYALPFVFEQETPSLRQALRNGAVMLGDNPFFSISLGLLLACALLAGTLFFFVSLAVGGLFVALASNYAVLNRLETWRARQHS